MKGLLIPERPEDFPADPGEVKLSEPIKQLGSFKVPIRVYKGVEPEITVEVVAEA